MILLGNFVDICIGLYSIQYFSNNGIIVFKSLFVCVLLVKMFDLFFVFGDVDDGESVLNDVCVIFGLLIECCNI